MEGLMEIHNRANFHLHSICGCQVIYLQNFWYQQIWRFWAAFGWFLGYYDPKSKFSQVIQCKANYHICYGF